MRADPPPPEPRSVTASERLAPWARPLGYGAGCGLVVAVLALVAGTRHSGFFLFAVPAFTSELQVDVLRRVLGVDAPRAPLLLAHAALQGAIVGAVLHLLLRRRTVSAVERCRALGRRFPWAGPAVAGAGLGLWSLHALGLPARGMGVWFRGSTSGYGSTGDYACQYGGSLHWRVCPRPGRPPCPYRPRWREVLALPTVLPGQVVLVLRPTSGAEEYALLVGLVALEGALTGAAAARLARTVRWERVTRPARAVPPP